MRDWHYIIELQTSLPDQSFELVAVKLKRYHEKCEIVLMMSVAAIFTINFYPDVVLIWGSLLMKNLFGLTGNKVTDKAR